MQLGSTKHILGPSTAVEEISNAVMEDQKPAILHLSLGGISAWIRLSFCTKNEARDKGDDCRGLVPLCILRVLAETEASKPHRDAYYLDYMREQVLFYC
jgi:hypothetical protein